MISRFLFLFSLLFLGTVHAQNSTEPTIGNGLEATPYEIATLDNLYWLSQTTSAWDKHFILTANIDADSTSEWDGGAGFSPIGNLSLEFSGQFNGTGKVIENLFINRPNQDFIGLFGGSDSGTIIDSVGLMTVSIIGENHVAGLVGRNRGTIQNSWVSGSVTGIHNLIGGLVANNSVGTIQNSWSSALVTGDGYVGGLVGQSFEGVIKNSWSSGSVNGDDYTGGLVGMNFYGTIQNSWSSSSVNGSDYAGGLVGWLFDGTVRNSWSSGSVNGDDYVGGLMGKNVNGTIENCWSTGLVVGANNTSSLVGGMLGVNAGGTIIQSFYDSEVSNQNDSTKGTPKTTEEMKRLSTYTDINTIGLDSAWDFFGTYNDDIKTEDIWCITDSISYPQFMRDSYIFSYNASIGGYIEGNATQCVLKGSSGYTVTAKAQKVGYYFFKWSDGVFTQSRTDTLATANKAVTANFLIHTFTLIYSAGEGGDVSDTIPHIVDYSESGPVITATPNNGYYFVNWSDSVDDNPRTDHNVIANKNISAEFSNLYTVTYSSSMGGALSGDSIQEIIYQQNSTTITALPDSGYHFLEWSDGDTLLNRFEVIVQNDTTITAFFAVDTVTITYSSSAHGYITGDSIQRFLYNGTADSMTAHPEIGYHFLKWSDDYEVHKRVDEDVKKDTVITAFFAIDTFTVRYASNANGSYMGDSVQQVTYDNDATTITAVPNDGYHFIQWSDGDSSITRQDLNIQKDTTIFAEFIINTYSITYTYSDNGFLTGTPQQNIDHGSDAQPIRAVPHSNYRFSHWSDSVTTNPRIDYNVLDSIDVIAYFKIYDYSLSYTVSGNGRIVGDSFQWLDYGGNGSLVTAVPDTGYQFVQWSDEITSPGRIDSSIVESKTVEAQFIPIPYTLSYSTDNKGTLKGDTIQHVSYGDSSSIITAIPQTGFHFVQWSDGNIQNPRRESSVTNTISVRAEFTINVYSIIYRSGVGGTVGGDTSQNVPHGDDGFTVTALPDSNYNFLKWSDGILQASRKELELTENIIVTAEYESLSSSSYSSESSSSVSSDTIPDQTESSSVDLASSVSSDTESSSSSQPLDSNVVSLNYSKRINTINHLLPVSQKSIIIPKGSQTLAIYTLSGKKVMSVDVSQNNNEEYFFPTLQSKNSIYYVRFE